MSKYAGIPDALAAFLDSVWDQTNNRIKTGVDMIKVATVALAAIDTGGGVFAWQNPEVGSIIIIKCIVDVTTIASGACSIDVGTTSVGATTQSDTLIDGLDVHSATGTFDTIDQAGANGKSRAKLATGKWVTGSKDSGASSGLVGNAYIYYALA